MKRPLPVTIIAILLILTGAGGLIAHFADFTRPNLFQFDVIGIALIQALAILSGVYLLFGKNWARWVAIVWITFHVVLSVFHSWSQTAVHVAIAAAFGYFLFRPPAARYFQA